MFFYGVASLANTGLQLAKDMKPAALWWVVAGGIAVGLNLIVIPRAVALGAVIVNSASYALVSLAVMIIAQRMCLLATPWTRLACMFVPTLGCGILLSALNFGTALENSAFKVPFVAAIALGAVHQCAEVSTSVSHGGSGSL